MKTVCAPAQCTGCMACVNICPRQAIKVMDCCEFYDAIINETDCSGCNLCYRICQVNERLIKKTPVYWCQGWSKDDEIRSKAASGGFATEISSCFIKNGGVVCSCIYEAGTFRFGFADNIKDIYRFMGSKYVKSLPQGVYYQIKKYLEIGREVLFIGLPCQVAGVKKYISQELQENLYTIDLICHGTPSPKIIEKYIKEMGYNINEISQISFRKKTRFRLSFVQQNAEKVERGDKYTIAFLNGLIYTKNCYFCDYATVERISDITIGDSWGSDLVTHEQKKGISLALCQTSKGVTLIKKANLHLVEVDIEKAIKNNRQLWCPSEMPKKRSDFFNLYERVGFNKLIWRLYPWQCFRRTLKNALLNRINKKYLK